MFGALASPPRRRASRAGLAAVLVAALLAGGMLAATPARGDETPAPAEEVEKEPNRVWRALKGVPGKVGSATKRAARGIGEGFDRDDEPAAEPAPTPVEKPAPAPVRRKVRPRPVAKADPPAAAVSEPQPIMGPPLPPGPPPVVEPAAAPAHVDRPALRRAALLAAFVAALAGVGLAVGRRGHPGSAPPPQPPADAPAPGAPTRTIAETMPLHVTADFSPPPTVAVARTTLRVPPSGQRTIQQPAGFDPAALDARTEAAVAEALAHETDARPTPFPGGGRYELLAEIGRGGMGVVYQARDKRLDRIVALKRLPENLQDHPRAVQMLLREARSAAQLNHPHIVTVYDVDHEDGAYFLTMEFLEGQPLATLLHRRGKLAASEVAWLGRQAAAGLAYAHERRIVHRDVKTGNLFLTRDRVLKIMDFGLAKMIEAVRRRSTRIGGTPDYMAPEQTLGLEVDERADLYSLGVTLFELLTGTVPFDEGDAMRHHRETRPPDSRERAPDVPAALAELVLELLAKKPDERPATAADVVERLRAIELATVRGDASA